ncbi:SPOR domain-containing protein [Marinomonas aquiplantarum]|uniref:Sporulation related protein n=1 Tax=Marinomonas aquiplantarum TaxID=491951 RepID=A0A366CVM2_9GAMM|nr:SPOR domain-containing protein [Marinomonas aquiplantarum]RBO81892.1 sporulation related protein [Marinomonas aquiplantarum]
MRKTIIIYFNILLVGIILVLYLPTYSNSKQANNTLYTVDGDSLIFPYSLSSLRLPPSKENAEYTLRVGLYRTLGQATDKAQTIQINAPIQVIKATDNQKEWFFILVGRYTNELAAEQAKQTLHNDGVASTVSVWPATANNG